MSNHHQVMRILVSRGRRKGGATLAFNSRPLVIRQQVITVETRKGVTSYTAVYNATKLVTGVPPQLTRFNVYVCA